MGMSATQARYLSLVAQQSNLEYQGQQINQERSILSQQVSELYNSLLNLQVPTPPSTSDYTKVEYTGADGATLFTIGNVKPSGENYLVEIQTSATGHALQSNYGSSVVATAGAEITGSYVTPNVISHEGEYELAGAGAAYKEGDIYLDENSYIIGSDLIAAGANPADYICDEGNGDYTAITSFDPDKHYYKKVDKSVYDSAENKDNYTHINQKPDETQGIEINAGQIANYYVLGPDGSATQLSTTPPYVKDNGDGTYTLDPNYKYFQKGNGNVKILDPNAGDLTIAGEVAYTFQEAKAEFGEEFDWSKYEEAIRNTYGVEDSSIKPDDFYVFVKTTDTGVRSVQFALKSDVESPDGFAKTFSYTASGQFTKSEEKDQCKLQFDAAGRITAISIPTIDETTGEIIGYRDVALTATTVTDELAYDEAMAKYEYAQYEYDKKQQEINAKTEVIQQQDRNLELKLQRLDTQRQQITTEIEALEKVMQDNIESSYKTFSG